MEDKVTIMDVARSAGVGVGTVSRVMNNLGGVTTETAEAVRRTMTELGYQPPPLNRRPGRRRESKPANESARLGLIIFGTQGLKEIFDTTPVYGYVLHGVQSTVEKLGGNLMIRNPQDPGTVLSAFREQELQGAIFFGTTPDEAMTHELERLPGVWVMGDPINLNIDCVRPHHLRIGQYAARYLCKQGHKHCAMLNAAPPEGDPLLGGINVGSRLTGFADTARHLGSEVLPLLDHYLIIGQDVQEERVAALIDRLANATPRPTGLFIGLDKLAASVYRNLERCGIMPGKDISIVTCNNERPFIQGLYPTPAVVDIRSEYIGQRAVERLMWRMENPEAPVEEILISPLLIGHEFDGRK